MSEDGTDKGIQTERALVVQEAIERDSVLEKFRSGDLLVHVVERPGIVMGDKGPELDLTTWSQKLEDMDSEGGMPYTSTTMIMSGVPIDLYVRPIGFLFDAGQVEIMNVNDEDSGSGQNPTNYHSLAELKDHYKNTQGSYDVNEVVVTAHRTAIIGLVMRKGMRSPSTLAGLEAVRNYLRSRDMKLPVYEYDERTGRMNKYQDPNRDKLLADLDPVRRAIYEKAI